MSFGMRLAWCRSATAFFFPVLLTFGLAACGSGGDLGPDPGIPPAITTQPASVTADDGATATFSVIATGAALAFQWQRDGNNILTSGTLATYTTPALTLADSGAVYTVVITNAAGTVTSNPATLTVVQAAARISTQPADTSVLDGSSATFSVGIGAGTPPITYQWRRNGAPIAGATAATYTTPPNTMSDTNTAYSVVVTAAGGTATSRDARLTVTARPPTMTTQPTNVSSQFQTGATFTAQASGTAPLAYQWLRNGIALSGETGTTLSTGSTNYGDDGARYSVIVSNAGGEITSASAVLTVTPPPGTLQEISSCQTLGGAGAYRLTANAPLLATADATCITINASNVQLDCGVPGSPDVRRSFGATGTNSRALRIGSGLQNISIKNCTIVTSQVSFDGVTNVSVHDNTFPAGSGLTSIDASGAVLLAFDNNTVAQGSFRQVNGRNVAVSNNRITASSGASSLEAVVFSAFGTGTRVLGNTLDGRWNSDRGSQVQNGAHSGIDIQDESDVVLEGNAVQDVFTCGVEFIGTLGSVTARDNRIANAGQCGFIGSYWFSMSSSRFVGNTIDRSAVAFYFDRQGGLRPAGFAAPGQPADTAIVFRDVVLERNILSNALASDSAATAPPTVVLMPITQRMGYSSATPPETEPAPSAFVLGNIRFANNNFDTSAAPMELGQGSFTPGLVIDGGGNRCPRSAQPGFPIVCGN